MIKTFKQQLLRELFVINKLSTKFALSLIVFGGIIYAILLLIDYLFFGNFTKGNNFLKTIADSKSLFAYISIGFMAFCFGLLKKIYASSNSLIHITSVREIVTPIFGIIYADIILVFVVSFSSNATKTPIDVIGLSFFIFSIINMILLFTLLCLRHDYSYEKIDKNPALLAIALFGILSIVIAWNL